MIKEIVFDLFYCCKEFLSVEEFSYLERNRSVIEVLGMELVIFVN